jgi:hypothetical protein
LDTGVLRPQYGAVLTSGVKDNAVGQRKFEFMAKIDSYAKAHGESRSGFLAEAARSAMR